MRYLSIDIETTGLNEEKHQILEFAAVLAETTNDTLVEDLPFFHTRIFWSELIGDPIALAMNANLIKEMPKKREPGYLFISELGQEFLNWLSKYIKEDDKISIGGKNFGSFDRRFLNKVVMWNWKKFHHRYLDPAICFYNQKDAVLPDISTCIERAGIDWDKNKLHNALEDARLVIQLLRVGLKNLRSISNE